MSDDNEERVAITTYVPEYQRDRWAAHADELDMSLSEFVRTMVQAGRKGFEEAPAQRPTPRGSALETALQDVLQDESQQFGELADEMEGRLERAVERLLDEGQLAQDVHGTLHWDTST